MDHKALIYILNYQIAQAPPAQACAAKVVASTCVSTSSTTSANEFLNDSRL